jgi:Zn-dependent protease
LKSDDPDTPDQMFLSCNRAIEVLQQVLPVFYGCLGAMAYVLRRISRETAERTYRSDYATSYFLRIGLGIVAGLAIGWFLHPQQIDTSGTISLSPFALAFVAGYSVDLLFAALDRIVAAFSGTPAGSVPANLTQTSAGAASAGKKQ